MNIVEWLKDLNLEKYVDLFDENGIDFEILPSLSPDDLKEAGVKAVGDRRKILNAIEELKAGVDKAPSVPPAPDLTQSPITERRQMTILFCDIVGSTEIVARSDPEEVRGLLTAFFKTIDAQSQAHSGYIAKRLGDGALIYFGYPYALENNAESAARASLSIVQEAAKLSWPDGTPLMVRVGFATGTVVVGDAIGLGEASVEVVGDTAHLAARLQSLAQPGQILIDERSRRLLGNLMRFEDYGDHELKGYSQPVRVSRVLGVSSARGRFAGLRAGRMSDFAGRNDSLNLLKSACQSALKGRGRPVCVSGPAGIGKSRITHELAISAQTMGMDVVSWFCSVGDQNTAFAPIIEHYSQLLENTETRDWSEILKKGTSDPAIVSALFDNLVGKPVSCPELAGYSPARIRRVTIEAIVEQVTVAAEERPVLLIVEDNHWVDPSTSEVLEILAGRSLECPLLVLITQRPEKEDAWVNEAHVEQVRLQPIDRDTCRAIVAQVFAERTLSDEQMQRIIDKADGIPLFAEELARSIADAEGSAVGVVPDTLRDALMSRVDRLQALRKVIQTAALVGRSFGKEILYEVTPFSQREVDETLQSMVAADIIEGDDSPGVDYRFQHALLQDTLASALLRNERTEIHGRIAEVLVAEQGAKGHTHDRIAHHFASAGQSMRALEFYVIAAQIALGRFANKEAVGHLDRALELIADAPTDEIRDEAELGIQTLRGLALMMLSGWAADEVGAAYLRAQQLWQKAGAAAPDRFPIAMGLLSYSIVRGDLLGSKVLGRDALKIAEEVKDDELISAAEHEYGACMVYIGEFDEAERRLSRCVDLYKPGEHDGHMVYCGKHQVVSGYIHLGMVNACRGRLLQKDEYMRRAIELAEHLNHPFSISFARLVDCSNMRCGMEVDRLEKATEIALELGHRQGYPHVIAQAMVLQGWTQGLMGRVQEGLALLVSGLEMWIGMGARLGIPQYHGLLSELQLLSGDPGGALKTVEKAIALQDETHEYMLSADIWRIKGDILRASDADGNTLKESYRTSFDLARRNGSPHFELVALSRLAPLDKEYKTEFKKIFDKRPAYVSSWLMNRLARESEKFSNLG